MSEKLSRETVREALDEWGAVLGPNLKLLPESTQIVVAAARAWLDLEDAIIIRKVDGEWPEQHTTAIAKHLYDPDDDGWWDRLTDRGREVRLDEATGLLDALSLEKPSPCESCNGTGYIEVNQTVGGTIGSVGFGNAEEHPCPKCSLEKPT